LRGEISAYIARREDLLGILRQILIEDLDVRREPGEIDPDAPLFGTGLGLDSVDAVELMVCVYSRLGVTLPGDMGGRTALRTLNTLVDHVIELQGEERNDA
jgi:acyl carrier protein